MKHSHAGRARPPPRPASMKLRRPPLASAATPGTPPLTSRLCRGPGRRDSQTPASFDNTAARRPMSGAGAPGPSSVPARRRERGAEAVSL
uniref:Uncharacterized protein n=1 Tax=Arundo donax TaxID=35708 RepID=A0A0A9HNG4_ARUDO